MPTKARKRKAAGPADRVDQFRGQFAAVVRGVEKSVTSVLRAVESRATSLERVVRRELARTLRDAAKQLRRVERMVAPAPVKKVRVRTKKKAAPRVRAKPVSRPVRTGLAA
jgi:hypothetical protein